MCLSESILLHCHSQGIFSRHMQINREFCCCFSIFFSFQHVQNMISLFPGFYWCYWQVTSQFNIFLCAIKKIIRFFIVHMKNYNFILMLQLVDLFEFLFLKITYQPWFCGCATDHFCKILAIIFSNISDPFFLFSPSGTSIYIMLYFFTLSSIFLSFFFFLYLPSFSLPCLWWFFTENLVY